MGIGLVLNQSTIHLFEACTWVVVFPKWRHQNCNSMLYSNVLKGSTLTIDRVAYLM
jgi:hypothetical protein